WAAAIPNCSPAASPRLSSTPRPVSPSPFRFCSCTAGCRNAPTPSTPRCRRGAWKSSTPSGRRGRSVFDVILDTWSQGGIVLVPIFLAAFWGFVLLLRTWLRLGRGRGERRILPGFEAIAARLRAGDDEGARDSARRDRKSVV